HTIFTMPSGHDGNTDIDQPPFIRDAKATILRHAALGDIELTHDLDARDDRRVMLLGNWRHRLLKHAVDSVLDGDRVIHGLDMDVAGAPLERREDCGVD